MARGSEKDLRPYALEKKVLALGLNSPLAQSAEDAVRSPFYPFYLRTKVLKMRAVGEGMTVGAQGEVWGKRVVSCDGGGREP